MKHQEIMDKAYKRWQESKPPQWSKQEFWDQLDAQERFAIHIGNMNYQVQNGGFSQWHTNDYGVPEVVGYLLRVLPKINTAAALKVVELLKQYRDAVDLFDESDKENSYGDPIENAYEDFYDNLSPLDTEYYVVNEQFMADVQRSLDTGSWKGGHNVSTK